MNETGAIFSEDRIFRYVLWRIWDLDKPMTNIIGLNPSTADETTNDPTMRRCTSFSQEWGFGGFYMTNLFAFRTPYPNELIKAKDPIGIDNDKWIHEIHNRVNQTVLAWGTKGNLLNRDKVVYNAVKESSYCVDYTKKGFPKHPLYIKSGTKLKKYSMRNGM